ncbi:hypothetical protein AYO21_01731 [Fonsecaea monophora]|uniref:Uncharacterized protein n=1 Tax=Fonsecaea monophora TaxID=254056 RepID=A0A177FL65_9EURO|nr:hypothetical protein AYO21_01731 [Fonsecaea monophora]OAG43879.1 hypothetical protein AYO21_01731 [Fonsecaea monophora]
MSAAVLSMSIAPVIVSSTTGTTMQALDNLAGQPSGMATMMAAHSDQKTASKKRHWWSRFRRGRPCREMKTLDTAHPSRSSSCGPTPLDDDMFPRRIHTNTSSQSAPSLRMHRTRDSFGDEDDTMTKPPVEITITGPDSTLASRIESSSRDSCSSGNSVTSDISRSSTTDSVCSSMSSIFESRGRTSSGRGKRQEALGTKAMTKEQSKLAKYRARQDLYQDRSLDTLLLANAFIVM